MKASQTLLYVHLLFVIFAVRVTSMTVRLKTRAADGAALCALDPPTVNVSVATSTMVEAPVAVRCAMSCTSDIDCENFNYVSSPTETPCQLYLYQPNNFAVVPNCQHYHLHTGKLRPRVWMSRCSIAGFLSKSFPTADIFPAKGKVKVKVNVNLYSASS